MKFIIYKINAIYEYYLFHIIFFNHEKNAFL
jgi:hypothetical protein